MNLRLMKTEDSVAVALAVVLTVCAACIHAHLWPPHNSQKEDIYYSWLEGKRLCLGVNPYERVLEGELLKIQKCPAYLPLFYVLSGLSEKMGWNEFDDYSRFWRPVFLAAFLATGFTVFGAIRLRGSPTLGLVALILWYFNRWSLYVTAVANLDFLPILLLVVSLVMWKRRPWVSALLFGLSLSLKQIAIFATPLYIIWAWREAPRLTWRGRAAVILALAAAPTLISFPFLVWNAEGYVKSILFSTLRGDLGAFPYSPSLDYIMRWEGGLSRLPMCVVLIAIYAGAALRRLPPWSAACLVMIAFIAFNRTLFYQYFCWPIPLTMLALAEAADTKKNGATQIVSAELTT